MTEAEHLARMHPWLRRRVVDILTTWRNGADDETIRITESVRPLATQKAYFAEGKSKADGVREFSFHQFDPALACDCIIVRGGKIPPITDPSWVAYGEIAESEGLTWGGRWKMRDGPHVEVPEIERVRLVQAALGLVADGAWGPKTDAAVSKLGPLRNGRKGWGRMSIEAWAALPVPP